MQNYKFYEGVKKLTNFYLDVMYNPIIIGKENIPNYSFIFASNHINWQDPMILMYALQDETLNFMSKKELFENPLYRWFLNNMGSFPVDREKGDIKAIKHAITLLTECNNLGIFPEGTRNETLGEFKPGVTRIAQMANRLVVPCAITGDYSFRSDLILNIGEPIDFKKLDLNKKEKDEYLREQVKSLIIK